MESRKIAHPLDQGSIVQPNASATHPPSPRATERLTLGLWHNPSVGRSDARHSERKRQKGHDLYVLGAVRLFDEKSSTNRPTRIA